VREDYCSAATSLFAQGGLVKVVFITCQIVCVRGQRRGVCLHWQRTVFAHFWSDLNRVQGSSEHVGRVQHLLTDFQILVPVIYG